MALRFCEGSRTRFRVFLSSLPNLSQREAPFFLAPCPGSPTLLEDEAFQCGFPLPLLGRRGRELYNATGRGEEAEVRRLLAKGADPTWKNPGTLFGFDYTPRAGGPRRCPASEAVDAPQKEERGGVSSGKEKSWPALRSPAQATNSIGRGAQRDRGMREVGNGNGNGNGNGKGDDPQ